MSGVIQFTDIIDSSILGIFFEVSTDAVVVHVAEKLTVTYLVSISWFIKRLLAKKKQSGNNIARSRSEAKQSK